MRHVPIDSPALIEQAERAGVDLVRELGTDRKTVWRWKVRETTPNGATAIVLYVLVQRIEQRR